MSTTTTAKSTTTRNLRNLYQEFTSDTRMRPSNYSKKSLADDWTLVLPLYIPSLLSTAAKQLTSSSNSTSRHLYTTNVHLEFVADSQSSFGRIIYISIPELKRYTTSNRHELSRGLSLGEAYDFYTKLPEDILLEIVNTLFTFPTQSQIDGSNSPLRETPNTPNSSSVSRRADIERLKAQEYREHLKSTNAHYEFRNGTLYFVSDRAQTHRIDQINKMNERADDEAMIKTIRLMINTLIAADEFTAETLECMYDLYREHEVEERQPDNTTITVIKDKTLLVTRAIRQEEKATQRAILAQQKRLQAKINRINQQLAAKGNK